MSIVDKVIKQCFRDTKEYFLMMITGGILVTMLIAFLITALIAPLVLLLIFYGIYRTIQYLFEKSIYTEEGIMYQSLPVSADQVVVSRIFVGMIAMAVFWTMCFLSIIVGGVIAIGNLSILNMVDFALAQLYKIGIVTTVGITVAMIASLFFEVSLIFMVITLQYTTKAAKESGIVRGGIVFGMLALIRVVEYIILKLNVLIVTDIDSKILIMILLFTVINIALGCMFCKLIKNRLENNLQL